MATKHKFFVALVAVALLAASARAELELVQVQVLTRHGDRTPMKEISVSPAVWTCWANSLSMPWAGEVAAIPAPARVHSLLYIRGAEVLEGNCSAGQLTVIGQHQQQALGQTVANRYIDELNFLPSAYSPQEIYVRASETPRCVMSAQEFLAGMYPASGSSGTTQVIPVWTIDSSTDSMQLNPSLCPAMEELLVETLLENRTFVEKILEYLAPVTPAILKAFNTSDPLVGLEYYDTLVCRQAHGIPWPAGVTQTVFDFLTDAYNQIGDAVFSSGAFSMGPFFAQLLYNMDLVVANQGVLDPRFMLFSGHDTSVGPTLSALGVYPGLWPPYASHIYFELYQNVSSVDEFYVQTLYQDLPVVPRGCPNSMCPLAVFQALLSESIPDDYESACELKVPRRWDDDARAVRRFVRGITQRR